jgi:hypothetical protein
MCGEDVMSGRYVAGSIAAAMLVGMQGGALADTPQDRLAFWQGHWKFQSETKQTPYSHALTESGNAQCAWQFNRRYMVCEYVVDKMTPDDADKPDNLAILHFSDAEKSYVHTGVYIDGDPMTARIVIDGNSWVGTSRIPRRSGGMAVLRNTQELLSPSKWTMKTEISVDGGAHWTEISNTIATKTG